MPPLGHPMRARAIGLYKELHRLGRDYPEPNFHFIPKLQSMFRKFANLTDEAEVESKLKLAEYIKKETESMSCGTGAMTYLTALYSLKKYRTLRRRYYKEE